MINQIKDKAKKISRSNLLIWFCLWVFTFMVLQNSVTAKEVFARQNYSSTSMTEFINQKSFALLSANIKKSKNQYKTKFNLQSDYSLQKYISDENILQNKKYAPSDLVKIDVSNIVDHAGRSYLRQPAKLAFAKMANEFNTQFDKQFYLMSAYRTYGDQTTLFEYGCSLTRCAKIWWSEHQLWLAIDIHLAKERWYTKFSGEYLDRMNNNAYKYWFINTYRKGVDVDWKMNEVWHRRYVWAPFAATLFKKDLSFAQYYNLFYKLRD